MFNSLTEPCWDPQISESESYRAFKMKITKEKFKNQNLKGYEDIFSISWVIGMQTLEKEWFWHLICALCNYFDREKQNTFLVSTLYVLHTFLFKCNTYQRYAKWPTVVFGSLNMCTICTWSCIEIPISLEMNHKGPEKLTYQSKSVLRNQNQKGCCDIINNSWVTGT